MQAIREAILSGERDPGALAALPIPQTYRAVTVHRDEEQMFAGLASRDKDPRKSLHVEQVDVPELGPGEALVAVMASAINYNTVWTSIFEPVSTFTFLQRYGRTSPLARRRCAGRRRTGPSRPRGRAGRGAGRAARSARSAAGR